MFSDIFFAAALARVCGIFVAFFATSLMRFSVLLVHFSITFVLKNSIFGAFPTSFSSHFLHIFTLFLSCLSTINDICF